MRRRQGTLCKSAFTVGGGCPAEVNDGQWEHMKVYYRDCVDHGIVVAPRGCQDTWDLHFCGPSFALYDRLIENMICFLDVDPDKVYILGFSAGGDGVYVEKSCVSIILYTLYSSIHPLYTFITIYSYTRHTCTYIIYTHHIYTPNASSKHPTYTRLYALKQPMKQVSPRADAR